MIHILIVDRAYMVVEGMTQIIGAEEGMIVAAQTDNGASAVSLLHQQTFDVVVMEIALLGLSGLHWLGVMRSEFPSLSILIVTVYSEQQFGARCIRAGAAGFIRKKQSGAELVEAIRSVAQGQRYITPTVGTEIVAVLDDRSPEKRGLDLLSDREMEVLYLLGSGYKVREIASLLHFSENVVSSCRIRIRRKLGCTSNDDLINYAFQEGLIEQ
jgi:two-component system, NarL family, invasion response regulator UvrY